MLFEGIDFEASVDATFLLAALGAGSGAGRSRRAQIAPLRGCQRHDSIAGSAPLFISRAERVRDRVWRGRDDLSDGLHRLFCIQHGANRMDSRLRGFPIARGGRGVAAATLGSGASNFLVSLTFLSLIKTAGNTPTFLIYAAFCIVTLLFVRFIVPETKGRELETISSDTRPYSTSGEGGRSAVCSSLAYSVAAACALRLHTLSRLRTGKPPLRSFSVRIGSKIQRRFGNRLTAAK